MSKKHSTSQPARKAIKRINEHGNTIDTWGSIRQMCKVLHFDRRAVIRVLKKEPKHKTVHGYTFKQINNGFTIKTIF